VSEDVTISEDVTVSHRGAAYEIGRGRHFYGIWAAGTPRSQPLAWWPQTPEGWSGAWARFCELETPGTIVAVSPPVVSPPVVTPPAARNGGGRNRALIAAGLAGAGVACGIAGLFPGYVGGPSLAQLASSLAPHVIYLAVWSASAVLIMLGPARRQVGALLGTGMSIVTFGLFFADAGQVIAGGAHLIGAGLVLGLIGWLACTAGSVLALWPRPAGAQDRPRGHLRSSALTLTLATAGAIGTAVAFVPSWDSFTLRTSGGLMQYVAAGNAFANPGAVIAGNVAVMVALVAVAAAAALWYPVQHGAALLAGAVVAMAAQAISALVHLGESVSPAQFGISPAQAAQAGLTISPGLTASFWIYCVFVAALAGTCALMISLSRPAVPAAAPLAPAGGAPAAG
jgi:hypothetical protein